MGSLHLLSSGHSYCADVKATQLSRVARLQCFLEGIKLLHLLSLEAQPGKGCGWLKHQCLACLCTSIYLLNIHVLDKVLRCFVASAENGCSPHFNCLLPCLLLKTGITDSAPASF